MEENNFGYFNYLKTVHGKKDGIYLCESRINLTDCVKSNEYYNFLSFKSLVCAIIYNGINMFPDINVYTIEFTNNYGTTSLVFRDFCEVGEDRRPCLCKLYSMSSSAPDHQFYNLTLDDIKQLYCNNHYSHVENDTVNTLIVILHMGGWQPIIKTTFNNNPKFIKSAMKN